MKCNRCKNEVEGWYFAMNEGWDGEDEFATCSDCGIAAQNKFRAAAGLPLVEKEAMLEQAREWGYV